MPPHQTLPTIPPPPALKVTFPTNAQFLIAVPKPISPTIPPTQEPFSQVTLPKTARLLIVVSPYDQPKSPE